MSQVTKLVETLRVAIDSIVMGLHALKVVLEDAEAADSLKGGRVRLLVLKLERLPQKLVLIRGETVSSGRHSQKGEEQHSSSHS
jgi:hypothetical protein